MSGQDEDLAAAVYAAAENVRRDELQALNAALLVPVAEARLAELERRTRETGTRGYLVEMSELSHGLGKLRAALAATSGIVAFRAPARRYAPRGDLGAEMAARFGVGATPADTERGAVLVVRVGQTVVRRQGRARVEDAYAVIVGPSTIGVYHRRLAIKFGVHAELMDSAGAWPFWAYLRGRTLARWRYLLRRARRLRLHPVRKLRWGSWGAAAAFRDAWTKKLCAAGAFVSDLVPYPNGDGS